jgi:hypothetical protein
MTNIPIMFTFCPRVLKRDLGYSSHNILYAGVQLLKIVFVLIDKVRNHLNHSMPGRWLSRGTPIAWPPGSSTLDFLWWGCVRNVR